MDDTNNSPQSDEVIEMSDLVVVPENSGFLAPVVSLNDALQAYQLKKEFIQAVMKEGIDFGPPFRGSDKKTLLKPGMEKLCALFGLTVVQIPAEVIEDWTGKDHGGEMFLYYRTAVELWKDGKLVGRAEGSCCSWESKYRYRWVSEDNLHPGIDKTQLQSRGGKISEFAFAIDKAETSGQYGKPAEYWQRFQNAIQDGTAKQFQKKTAKGQQYPAWEIDALEYRIPNPDQADVANTCLKMSFKRGLGSVVQVVTGVSEWFTVDLDDFYDFDNQPVVVAGNFSTTDNQGSTDQPAIQPTQKKPERNISDRKTPPPSSATTAKQVSYSKDVVDAIITAGYAKTPIDAVTLLNGKSVPADMPVDKVMELLAPNN